MANMNKAKASNFCYSNCLSCYKAYSDDSFFSLVFTKVYAVIQEVIGITKATPIPAQSIVIISVLNTFEFRFLQQYTIDL